ADTRIATGHFQKAKGQCDYDPNPCPKYDLAYWILDQGKAQHQQCPGQQIDGIADPPHFLRKVSMKKTGHYRIAGVETGPEQVASVDTTDATMTYRQKPNSGSQEIGKQYHVELKLDRKGCHGNREDHWIK